MPVIKSAKKKLRQDKKRTVANEVFEDAMKKAVKAAKKAPSEKTVSAAFKAIDKAVKKFIIHKNKAARVKSSLSKLIADKSAIKKEKPAEKLVEKKAAKPTKKVSAKKK